MNTVKQENKGETMEYIAIGFGVFGFLAFIRTEKLIKTLKEKGLLDAEYKAD